MPSERKGNLPTLLLENPRVSLDQSTWKDLVAIIFLFGLVLGHVSAEKMVDLFIVVGFYGYC